GGGGGGGGGRGWPFAGSRGGVEPGPAVVFPRMRTSRDPAGFEASLLGTRRAAPLGGITSSCRAQRASQLSPLQTQVSPRNLPPRGALPPNRTTSPREASNAIAEIARGGGPAVAM